MRMRIAAATLMLLLVSVSLAQMQETGLPDDRSPVMLTNSEQFTMTSAANGHEYRISVALPDSYGSTEQTYPVLYLLDSQVTVLSATENVRFLAYYEEVPELIIVGIGYPTDDVSEISALRERDYYTQPDEFLQFISDEVFPLVDDNYRTDPTDRGLIGYSYGGELVFHILTTNVVMFNRYAAIDAASGELMPYLMRDDDDFRASFAEHDIRLFLSTEGTEMIGAALQTRAYEGLTVTSASLGNVTHSAALHISLPQAIIAMYGG